MGVTIDRVRQRGKFVPFFCCLILFHMDLLVSLVVTEYEEKPFSYLLFHGYGVGEVCTKTISFLSTLPSLRVWKCSYSRLPSVKHEFLNISQKTYFLLLYYHIKCPPLSLHKVDKCHIVDWWRVIFNLITFMYMPMLCFTKWQDCSLFVSGTHIFHLNMEV